MDKVVQYFEKNGFSKSVLENISEKMNSVDYFTIEEIEKIEKLVGKEVKLQSGSLKEITNVLIHPKTSILYFDSGAFQIMKRKNKIVYLRENNLRYKNFNL